MGKWLKRLGLLLFVLAIGAGFYFAMREQPVTVDLAEIKTGPMSVTIEEEGVARVRDIYTVSSPIAGHLDRTKLEEGEAVIANKTIIASIHPPDPPFLDERTKAELEAAAEAAKSAVALAQVEHTRAQMALELIQSEYDRASKLAKTNVISESTLERTYSDMNIQRAQVESTQAVIRLRKAELTSAEARLQQPADIGASSSDNGCCVNLTSPIDGVVLKVVARSEQAVTSGMPITEIGDPANLEIVVDLLSSDAPKIKTGSKAIVTNWGGETELGATVRRIDPAAFTKISSLGIDEQRVNAILDLESVPPDLGHGYRVLTRLIVWSQNNVLQIPIGALFRSEGSWATFVVTDGRAILRKLSIGQMNQQSAQILEGLQEGESTILYPNDLLEDGSLVIPR